MLKENYGNLYTKVMNSIQQSQHNKQLRRQGPPKAPEKLRDGAYIIDIGDKKPIVDIPIVVPRASILSDEELSKISINSTLPSSYGALSACAHIQTRILFCKYKLGLRPSPSEKQMIERTLRRLNRDMTRTVEAEGFLLVDRRSTPPMSPNNLEAQEESNDNNEEITDASSISVYSEVITVFVRFPLYLLFIFFMAFYDVLFDERFRRRVRRTITWEN